MSAWVFVSTAVAALFGGGLGAMLQGRYGTSSWRRDTRLQAYTHFIELTHDFDDYIEDAFASFGKPDFDDRWKKVRDVYWQISRAGSLVSVAGPLSVDAASQKLVLYTHRIIDDGKDIDVLSAVAAEFKKGEYENLHHWINSAGEFAAVARAALKTQGVLPYRRLLWFPLRGIEKPTDRQRS
jgi:hypothetical protein